MYNQEPINDQAILDIIESIPEFKTAWDLEHDSQVFIESLPEMMVQRDLALERLNKKPGKKTKVTGRKGNLAQWKIIVAFYIHLFGLDSSFYSGETLVLLQRAGLMMSSFQRMNDWWFYYENFLRWLLYVCSSLEQVSLINVADVSKIICKTSPLKYEHLKDIVKLWDEGRGSHSEQPASVPRNLSSAEKDGIETLWKNQESNATQRNQLKRQGNHNQTIAFCKSNRIDTVLWATGNWIPRDSRLLSIDSLITGSVYTYSGAHFSVYKWMNDALQAQNKAFEDLAIDRNFALRSKLYKELKSMKIMRLFSGVWLSLSEKVKKMNLVFGIVNSL